MKSLVLSYIDGWLQSDKQQILDTLATDCKIIESHGAYYEGKEHVASWIDDWLAAGKVLAWNVTSFHTVGDISFFEWNFRCKIGKKTSGFEGASIARVQNGRIVYLREYKMSKPMYRWGK